MMPLWVGGGTGFIGMFSEMYIIGSDGRRYNSPEEYEKALMKKQLEELELKLNKKRKKK